jgi:hypothetical protein
MTESSAVAEVQPLGTGAKLGGVVGRGPKRQSCGDLLLANTVPRPRREWVQNIPSIVGVTRIIQPSLWHELLWVGPVFRAFVSC